MSAAAAIPNLTAIPVFAAAATPAAVAPAEADALPPAVAPTVVAPVEAETPPPVVAPYESVATA